MAKLLEKMVDIECLLLSTKTMPHCTSSSIATTPHGYFSSEEIIDYSGKFGLYNNKRVQNINYANLMIRCFKNIMMEREKRTKIVNGDGEEKKESSEMEECRYIVSISRSSSVDADELFDEDDDNNDYENILAVDIKTICHPSDATNDNNCGNTNKISNASACLKTICHNDANNDNYENTNKINNAIACSSFSCDNKDDDDKKPTTIKTAEPSRMTTIQQSKQQSKQHCDFATVEFFEEQLVNKEEFVEVVDAVVEQVCTCSLVTTPLISECHVIKHFVKMHSSQENICTMVDSDSNTRLQGKSAPLSSSLSTPSSCASQLRKSSPPTLSSPPSASSSSPSKFWSCMSSRSDDKNDESTTDDDGDEEDCLMDTKVTVSRKLENSFLKSKHNEKDDDDDDEEDDDEDDDDEDDDDDDDEDDNDEEDDDDDGQSLDFDDDDDDEENTNASLSKIIGSHSPSNDDDDDDFIVFETDGDAIVGDDDDGSDDDDENGGVDEDSDNDGGDDGNRNSPERSTTTDNSESSANVSNDQPARRNKKKVRFSDTVDCQIIDEGDEKECRKGHWELFALDRARFRKRINEAEPILAWLFYPNHRNKMTEIVDESRRRMHHL